jgi:hypothetical protein
MKVSILIIVLVFFLLPGCTGEKDRKIAELAKKVEELTKEKEQDIFKKKIECKKYEESARKSLSADRYQMDFLQSVFYSSKKNSCLAAIRSMYLHDNGEILYIEDVLTHEQIWYKDFHPIQNAGVAASRLNEQIKLLE